MLAIVVDNVANFIAGKYSLNQWLCCKNTRNSYFSQYKNVIKNKWLHQQEMYIYNTSMSGRNVLSRIDLFSTYKNRFMIIFNTIRIF